MSIENEKRQAAVNRLVILAQVIILNEEDLRYLCKVLEKEETKLWHYGPIALYEEFKERK